MTTTLRIRLGCAVCLALLPCAGQVQAAIKVGPATLPDWTIGMPYPQTLTATGCTTPCSWSRSGTLPTGLTLDSASGSLSGTPSATGSFHFTVTATSLLQSGSQSYAVAINPLPSITTASLPGGQLGTRYSQTIAVTNGTAPYKYSVSSGALPAGISLDSSTGVLSGTPGVAGSFAFTVLATDQAAASASHAYALAINSLSALAITTASPLPGGSVGVAYALTLAASGGAPPYSWSVVGGSLPGGLRLNSTTGVMGGDPSTAGSFAFTVRVTDQALATLSQTFSLAISAAPAIPSMSLANVPDTASSAQQVSFGLVLSSGYSVAITGQITLSFQPDAAAQADDPSIQFSTGGRTTGFTIPARATDAVFTVSPIAFQTGTVAGTITLAVTSSLPGGTFTRSVVVSRGGPVIQTATVTPNASGFQVRVTGFSNSRELTNATFHFTAASGQTVQTSDLTVSLSSVASQWFSASGSAQFGGQVLIVVPFTVQQGSPSALTSVAVILQNTQGASLAVTSNF
ncbi:MAG: Ig domain-containing protein [Acidobacteriia bacterium]|nr:Ig domain-containing protein [Terriglobia bacterium]